MSDVTFCISAQWSESKAHGCGYEWMLGSNSGQFSDPSRQFQEEIIRVTGWKSA